MNIYNSYITAFKSLRKNKLRSALTSVGIIIGVWAVIVMVGLGSSASISIKERMNNFGTNALALQSAYRKWNVQDIETLKSIFPQIRYITPVLQKGGNIIKYHSKGCYSPIMGINNDYFKLKHWPLASGRIFTEDEIYYNEKVVIIGNAIKEKVFENENDVIGKILIINNDPYRVIGLFSEIGMAFSGRNLDDILMIPYTTMALKITGIKEFEQMFIGTYSETQVEKLAKILRRFYEKEYYWVKGYPGFFRVTTSKESLKMIDLVMTTLYLLLIFIASISLIDGGIGIMNIMLVSVSKRTREIGIRMAIGAKGRDILMQFLVEAVLLSGFGGIIGIILGLLLYAAIVFFAKWPFILSPGSILLAFFVASLTGIIAGMYPARKAANLNPIDALRIE